MAESVASDDTVKLEDLQDAVYQADSNAVKMSIVSSVNQ